MAFLANEQIQEFIHFAHLADMEARSDLSRGFIKGENDYTSNFTGAFRRMINTYSRTGLTATSFLLPPIGERATGGDAAIIISRGNDSKVAVFEAKWPRFSNAGYEWDYPQTATGLSHFSDQLERQKKWSGVFAVFEMFYCEYPFGEQPLHLRSHGSSCVWHDDVERFRANREEPDEVWSQEELDELLRGNGLGLPRVLMAFGECSRGQVISRTTPERIGEEYRLPENILEVTAEG